VLLLIFQFIASLLDQQQLWIEGIGLVHSTNEDGVGLHEYCIHVHNELSAYF
jgi:hypothetical protein